MNTENVWLNLNERLYWLTMGPFTDYRLWIIGFGTLIVPLDSAVNVAFPHIAKHFSVAPADLRLVVVTFILTNICLLLIFGRIGDLWGYRRIFRLGLAVSAVALLLDAMAPSYALLLAARVGQGVGAALIISCGPALAIGLFPEDSRGPAIGAYAMIFALGTAIGPIVGGWLIAVWDWSAVFWFRVPLALIALLLTPSLPAPRPRTNLAEFDLTGAVLLGLSIGSLFVAVNLMPTDVAVAAAVQILAVILIAIFIRQQRGSESPVINLGYFRNWRFSGLNLASIFVNFSAFSVMLVVPFYLPRTGGLGVMAAGLVLAAYPVGLAIASLAAGRLIRDANGTEVRARILRGVGTAAVALGLIGVVSWGSTPLAGLVAASIGITGAGLGLYQAAFLYTVTGALPPEERGVAGSLAEMMRSMGNLTSATFLFELFRSRAASEGFLGGFTATYSVAAITAATVLAVVIVDYFVWRRSLGH